MANNRSIAFISKLFIIIQICVKNVTSLENQKLLMILLDGFRWDYLNQPDLHLPGFQRIKEMGVKADYLKPVYPTLSYPNYYSLTTGLYVESHGMIGNYMFDAERNESFIIGTNPDQFNAHWWDKAEPIWVSAEKQDKRSYMYFWPGCEVTIRKTNPTHCRPYSGPPSMDDYKRAISDILRKFQSNEADLGGVYFEQFDVLGHNYGPLSLHVNQAIKDLDGEMLRLTDEIQRMGLKDKVNVVIFSDHGMTKMTNRILIDIRKVVNQYDYVAMMDQGPISSIWPNPGKERELYFKLRNFHPKMHVYLKENVPKRYHYKDNRLVAPITMIADRPYFIVTPEYPAYPIRKIDFRPKLGAHGYDDKDADMRGIFMGFGPSYRANERVDGFETVEIYQMMTRILGILPQPHNGTWSNVDNMLTEQLPRLEGLAWKRRKVLRMNSKPRPHVLQAVHDTSTCWKSILKKWS